MEACFTSFLFSVYLRSLSPSIAGGDAGELVAESCHLGVAHPPGYPLFILITHFFTKHAHFLGGTEAFRANLGAAICDAIACLLISLTIKKIASSWNCDKESSTENAWISKIIGCCFGTLYGLSPLVWQYAVTAEVFALNNLFAALIIWAATQYAFTENPFRWALIGAFVCGLGLCNQHTLLLLELPVVLWVLVTLWPHLQSQFVAILSLAAVFFLGLSPYGYLAVAMRLRPQPGSWGDTTTLAGFFHHLRRADYGSFQLYSGDKKSEAEPLPERLIIYGRDLWHRQGLWGFVPVLAGIGVLCVIIKVSNQTSKNRETNNTEDDPRKSGKRSSPKVKKSNRNTKSTIPKSKTKSKIEDGAPDNKTDHTLDLRQSSLAPMLVFSLAFYLVVFHSLSNLPLKVTILYGVHARFWMQPNQLVFILAGLGLSRILHKISDILNSRMVGYILALVCTVVTVYLQLTQWFELNDQSQSKWFDYYARSILEPMPENSLMITNYDQQWTSLRYLHICEGVGRGKNITIIHLSMMSYTWWGSKRSLYSDVGVVFPNIHYGQRYDPTAFTWGDFVTANYNNFPGGIYLGGKLSHPDPEFDSAYEMIPYGFTDRAVRRDQIPGILKWHKESRNLWKQIFTMFPPLPPESKYNEETWEWTIGREFFDHLGERGAYLLEGALAKGAGQKGTLKAIIEAAWWIEHVVAMDKRHGFAHYKNLGLAYMNLVRTKEFDDTVPLSGFRGGLVVPNVTFPWPEGANWKSWASTRFVECWTTFVEHKDAIYDSQYEMVKGILNQVLHAANKGSVS